MNYIERKSYRKGQTEIVLCHTEVPRAQAQMAIDLMRHLSIVAAVPDGEDSSGRQKSRLMTEEEVVNRANSIAAYAWKQFRAIGWLLDVPLPKVGEGE